MNDYRKSVRPATTCESGPDKEIEIRGNIPVARQILSMLRQVLDGLQHLTNEVKRMTTQETALAQAVGDLTTAFNANTAAIAAELDSIKNSGAGDDPVVATAITNIEGIVSQLNAATTAAQAATVPPANDTGDGSTSTDTTN